MTAMARVGQVGVEAAKDSSVTMENRADTAGGEAAGGQQRAAMENCGDDDGTAGGEAGRQQQ